MSVLRPGMTFVILKSFVWAPNVLLLPDLFQFL